MSEQEELNSFKIDPKEEFSVQDLAKSKGHKPKEEWEGDPEEWVDADEFLRRGELMDRISDQTKQIRSSQKEIKALKQGIDVLKEHNKKIAEKEYAKALESLKKQKKNALDVGDSDRVIEIDEQLEELKEDRKKLDSEEITNKDSNLSEERESSLNIPQEIFDWQDENPWYVSNKRLQRIADSIAAEYAQENPEAINNIQEVLDYVTETMEDEYHDMMYSNKNTNKKGRPSTTVDTTGSARAKRSSSKRGKYNPTPFQKKVAKTFADDGIMTEEEYYQQLKDLGEME